MALSSILFFLVFNFLYFFFCFFVVRSIIRAKIVIHDTQNCVVANGKLYTIFCFGAESKNGQKSNYERKFDRAIH